MSLVSKKQYGRVPVLDYNWNGWATLWAYLNLWGVDTSEFTGWNDGDPIGPETCRVIAQAIRKHFKELSAEDRKWLRGHAAKWQAFAETGGCLQW